jgi:hypothetical protein
MSNNPILWQASPEQAQASAMYQFMRKHDFDNYDDLHQWSVNESGAFWESLCEFCESCHDQLTSWMQAGSQVANSITLLTCCAMRAIALPSFFVAKMETGAS